MGAPIRSKACRCWLVGSASMAIVRRVPAKRTDQGGGLGRAAPDRCTSSGNPSGSTRSPTWSCGSTGRSLLILPMSWLSRWCRWWSWLMGSYVCAVRNEAHQSGGCVRSKARVQFRLSRTLARMVPSAVMLGKPLFW